MPSRSRTPDTANSSPTLNRPSSDCPRPTSRSIPTAPATLRSGWSYLRDFIAMSSPNHFACSCASEWQPTFTSNEV